MSVRLPLTGADGLMRVRPLSSKEFSENQTCGERKSSRARRYGVCALSRRNVLEYPNENQVGVDDHYFTYDRVFNGVTQRGAQRASSRRR